jgi:predicted nucleotidyltransferase
MSIIEKLYYRNLLPKIQYDFCLHPCIEMYSGSIGYGIADKNSSDVDITSIVIPSMEMLYPSSAGYINGFDAPDYFENYIEHNIIFDNKEYDVNIYSIVKLCNLAMKGNPNFLELLFMPKESIIYSSTVGTLLLDKRQYFLSNLIIEPFIGVAYSYYKSINFVDMNDIINNTEEAATNKKYANAIRALEYCKSLLFTGTLDMTVHAPMLHEIRNGNWTNEECAGYYNSLEKNIIKFQHKSILPDKPDMKDIKQLLNNILERSYG